MPGPAAGPRIAAMHGNEQQGSGGASSPRIVIAGGGVAALEAVLALRALADGHVDIELICPDPAFSYRPLTVLQAFDLPASTSLDLAPFCAQTGVHLRPERLRSVDTDAHEVVTESGDVVSYDRLLVATGARAGESIRGATVFLPSHDAQALRGALDHIDYGQARSLAFVAPDPDAWLVPLYELAFLARARLDANGSREASITVATAEDAPLQALGPITSDTVALALARHRIALRTGARATAAENRAVVLDDGARIPADHVVTLPRMSGAPVPGLPHDADGFIEIDGFARVRGAEDVYAAGDMTAGATKQGGVAARQADAAAESMLASLGFDVEAHPFSPVLEGLMLTGATFDLLASGDFEALAPPAKLVARYLAPYLANMGAATGDRRLNGIPVGGPPLHGAGHDPRATNPDLAIRLPRGSDPALLRAFVDGELGALADGGERNDAVRDAARRYLQSGGNVEAVAGATGRDIVEIREDLRRAEELLGRPLGERQFQVRLALELAEGQAR